MARRLLSRLRALASDRGGTVMVEFAVAFPVMVLLYIGSYTMSDAIAANRKVTITARALTDLATRYPSLTEADATTILNASAQVMSPYDVSNARIVLSEVKVKKNTGRAKVVWSRSLNGTSHDINGNVDIPDNMADKGTYLILGEVTYTYTPTARFAGFPRPITLTDSILMLPRVSDEVPLS
jgi:Flp pilus assembly protein TadG